jgi:putative flippase GtrA
MTAIAPKQSVKSDRHRFAAFLGAGVINTGFGYAAFAFFLWTGIGNDLAVICGTISGVLFNFGTFRTVFSSRGLSRLPHFLAVYGALLVINILALRWLTAMGINPYLGQGIVVAAITPISFLSMRRFVFAVAPELHP